MISAILDESAYAVKLELTKEKKQREEMEDEFSGEISSHVSKLNEVLENETLNREEASKLAIARINEEFKRFGNALNEERKIRENNTVDLSMKIQDFNMKIANDLANEKKERVATEETLINVLEETCVRIEQNIRDPYYS